MVKVINGVETNKNRQKTSDLIDGLATMSPGDVSSYMGQLKKYDEALYRSINDAYISKIYDKIMSLPMDKRNSAYNFLDNKTKKKVMTLRKKDMIENEYKELSSFTSNDQRARYWLMTMDKSNMTPEEKNSYINDLIQKKIITKNLKEKIYNMIKSNKNYYQLPQ
jgi:replicative DNA helicase